MRKTFLSCFLLIIFLVEAKALVISNFGSSVTVLGSTGFTYNPSTSLLSGTEAGGDVLYNSAPFSLSLTGATGVALTASATTAPSGPFSITLTDNTGKVAIANGFTYTSFLAGPKTVQKSFSSVASLFNFSNVTDFSLDSGGSGQALSITLTQLQSVPEPSAWSALVVGAITLGIAACRRLRSSN